MIRKYLLSLSDQVERKEYLHILTQPHIKLEPGALVVSSVARLHIVPRLTARLTIERHCVESLSVIAKAVAKATKSFHLSGEINVVVQ
jgi:hypothetical protein